MAKEIQKSSSPFFLYSVLIGLVLIVLLYFNFFSEPTNTLLPNVTPDNTTTVMSFSEILKGAPSRGDETSKVTLVEFSDFQCPLCKKYFDETYVKLFYKYGDRIHYVFKNFPITELHANADIAAQAAFCAQDQDRFWEYHDALFNNQANWKEDPNFLYIIAGTLQLDEEAFDSCLSSEKYKDAVQEDFQQGIALGVTGTPTFFINNQMVRGAQDISLFTQVIDSEFAK
jgi:protein-disulfide isomerase